MSESENKTELIRKAFEFKSRKKYGEAIDLFKAALKINTDTFQNAEIHAQTGEIYIILKDLHSALEEFQKALSLDSSHKFSIQKCFDIYFELGQYQKALCLSKKICEEEKNAASYLNYFKALYKLGKFQDIIEIFNSLDENIKLEPDILYLLSLTDEDKKEILLNKVLEKDDMHLRANLDLAEIAFKKGDYNKVIQCCVNLDANIARVSYYLGVINFKEKNYNKSTEYFINAIKNDNNENDYYFDLAKVYIEMTYYSEALDCINQSIKYSLINNKKEILDEKYFLSGWILFRQKQYQSSLLNLNLVNKKSKFYTSAKIVIQAINIRQNKDIAKAKKILEEIYEKQPDNSILLDTLALAYKSLKMPNKAVKIYNKALKLYPDSLFYRLELIDLYIDISLYSDAMIQIEFIQQKTKNCACIYNSLARIYYRLNDYANALDSIEEYLKLDKNNPESCYFKGLILNKTNKFKEAKDALYNAITLNPNAAKYYFQTAKSFYGLNEYEDALLYAKEAIDMKPDEISFKELAYKIALKTGNKNQIELYEKQLKRSEGILKGL